MTRNEAKPFLCTGFTFKCKSAGHYEVKQKGDDIACNCGYFCAQRSEFYKECVDSKLQHCGKASHHHKAQCLGFAALASYDLGGACPQSAFESAGW